MRPRSGLRLLLLLAAEANLLAEYALWLGLLGRRGNGNLRRGGHLAGNLGGADDLEPGGVVRALPAQTLEALLLRRLGAAGAAATGHPQPVDVDRDHRRERLPGLERGLRLGRGLRGSGKLCSGIVGQGHGRADLRLRRSFLGGAERRGRRDCGNGVCRWCFGRRRLCDAPSLVRGGGRDRGIGSRSEHRIDHRRGRLRGSFERHRRLRRRPRPAERGVARRRRVAGAAALRMREAAQERLDGGRDLDRRGGGASNATGGSGATSTGGGGGASKAGGGSGAASTARGRPRPAQLRTPRGAQERLPRAGAAELRRRGVARGRPRPVQRPPAEPGRAAESRSGPRSRPSEECRAEALVRRPTEREPASAGFRAGRRSRPNEGCRAEEVEPRERAAESGPARARPRRAARGRRRAERNPPGRRPPAGPPPRRALPPDRLGPTLVPSSRLLLKRSGCVLRLPS